MDDDWKILNYESPESEEEKSEEIKEDSLSPEELILRQVEEHRILHPELIAPIEDVMGEIENNERLLAEGRREEEKLVIEEEKKEVSKKPNLEELRQNIINLASQNISKYYPYEEFNEFKERLKRFLPKDIPIPSQDLFNSNLTPMKFPEMPFGYEYDIESLFFKSSIWSQFYTNCQRKYYKKNIDLTLEYFVSREIIHRDDPEWRGSNYIAPLIMFYYMFGCIFETNTLINTEKSEIFNIYDLHYSLRGEIVRNGAMKISNYIERQRLTEYWLNRYTQLPMNYCEEILNNACWGMEGRNMTSQPNQGRIDTTYHRLFTNRHINIDLMHVFMIFFHKILLMSFKKNPSPMFIKMQKNQKLDKDFPIEDESYVAYDPYSIWMNLYLVFIQNLKYPLYKNIIKSWYNVQISVGNVRRTQIRELVNVNINIPREMGNLVYWRKNFDNINTIGNFFQENDSLHRNLFDVNWFDEENSLGLGKGTIKGFNSNLALLMGEYVFALLNNVPKVPLPGRHFANLIFSFYRIVGLNLGDENYDASNFYRVVTIQIDMFELASLFKENAGFMEWGREFGEDVNIEVFGRNVMNYLLMKISEYFFKLLNIYEDELLHDEFQEINIMDNTFMIPKFKNIADNLMQYFNNISLIALNYVGLINKFERKDPLVELRAFHSTLEGWCDIHNPSERSNCIISCLKFVISEEYRIIRQEIIPFHDDLTFTMFIHDYVGSKWVLMLTYVEKGQIYESLKIFNSLSMFKSKIILYVYRSDQLICFNDLTLRDELTFTFLLYKTSVGIISKNLLQKLIYFRQNDENWEPMPKYTSIIFNEEGFKIKHTTYKIYGVNQKRTQMDYKLINKDLVYTFKNGREVVEHLKYKENKRINRKKFKSEKYQAYAKVKIFAYDIETVVKNYNVNNKEHYYSAWCICLVDEKDVKEYFWGESCVKDFIYYIMKLYDENEEKEEDEKSHILIYSFNGAKFDNLFIILYLLSAFANNCTILGKIQDIKAICLGKLMSFLDLRLIFTRGKLNELSRDILGEEKLDFDVMKYVRDLKKFEENKDDIIKYCFQDCYLTLKLVNALRGFIHKLFEICDDKKFLNFKWFHPTLSLLSINLWQKLTPSCQVIVGCEDFSLYQIEKSSYYGGMTLNIIKYFKFISSFLYHYDIMSSYPSVMVDCTMPIKFKKNLKYDKVISLFLMRKIVPYYLYRVKYEFKDNCKIPCFPTRISLNKKGLNGLIYFKSNYDQTNDSWIWGIELMTAKFQLKKCEIFEEQQYFGEKIFADYITLIYREREKAKKEKNNSFAYFLKLLMNSCYGKFGQQKYSTNLYMNGNELQEYLCNENQLDINAKIKNINILDDLPNNETIFNVKLHPNSSLNWIGSCVKISSYIAAHARSNLYYGMLEVGLENVYYFDTDSIFTTKPIKNSNLLRNELGGWSCEEDNIVEAYFLNPKVYYYKTDDGKEVYKCKGIPSKFLNKEFFLKLIEEDKASIKNLKNIYHKLNKILFKEDKTKNIEVLDVKRIFHNDGDSEPYYNLTQLKENL